MSAHFAQLHDARLIFEVPVTQAKRLEVPRLDGAFMEPFHAEMAVIAPIRCLSVFTPMRSPTTLRLGELLLHFRRDTTFFPESNVGDYFFASRAKTSRRSFEAHDLRDSRHSREVGAAIRVQVVASRVPLTLGDCSTGHGIGAGEPQHRADQHQTLLG